MAKRRRRPPSSYEVTPCFTRHGGLCLRIVGVDQPWIICLASSQAAKRGLLITRAKYAPVSSNGGTSDRPDSYGSRQLHRLDLCVQGAPADLNKYWMDADRKFRGKRQSILGGEPTSRCLEVKPEGRTATLTLPEPGLFARKVIQAEAPDRVGLLGDFALAVGRSDPHAPNIAYLVAKRIDNGHQARFAIRSTIDFPGERAWLRCWDALVELGFLVKEVDAVLREGADLTRHSVSSSA